MRLRRLADGIAWGWNVICGDVHRAIAARRQGQALANRASANRHLEKADEHDWRADAYGLADPTELDAGGEQPARPFDHV